MTEQTVNRRTSIYTIHLQDAAAAETAARGLRDYGVAVVDHGEVAVSFRTTDDERALSIAHAAARWCHGNATLTTGLGAHKRAVTA